MSIWSDGAPSYSKVPPLPGKDAESMLPKNAPLPKDDKPLSAPEKAARAVSRIRQFEGPRGYSTRFSVYLRYVAYFALIVACSSMTEVFTKDIPNAAGGGRWMFFASAVIVLGGAIASLFYTNLRNEIIEKVRHFIFGISLFPGTLVALFLYITQDFLGEDAFGGTLQIALPVVFLATVIIPAIVFVKEMVGIRTIHRSKLDDQEAVMLWTRQDGHQR